MKRARGTITKLLKFKNEGASPSVYRIEIDRNGLNFSISTNLKGPAVDFGRMVCAIACTIAAELPEKTFKEVLNYERTSPFIFKEHDGMSGCSDFYLRYEVSHGIWKNSKKLHCSCNGKFNDGEDNFFTPDFLEIGARICGESFSHAIQWGFYSGDPLEGFKILEPEEHEGEDSLIKSLLG